MSAEKMGGAHLYSIDRHERQNKYCECLSRDVCGWACA